MIYIIDHYKTSIMRNSWIYIHVWLRLTTMYLLSSSHTAPQQNRKFGKRPLLSTRCKEPAGMTGCRAAWHRRAGIILQGLASASSSTGQDCVENRLPSVRLGEPQGNDNPSLIVPPLESIEKAILPTCHELNSHYLTDENISDPNPHQIIKWRKESIYWALLFTKLDSITHVISINVHCSPKRQELLFSPYKWENIT